MKGGPPGTTVGGFSKHPVQSLGPQVQRGGRCKLAPHSGPLCPPHPIHCRLPGPSSQALPSPRVVRPSLRLGPRAAAPVASRGGRTFSWPCFTVALAPQEGSVSRVLAHDQVLPEQRRSRDGRPLSGQGKASLRVS